jgi:hypothetical protein
MAWFLVKRRDNFVLLFYQKLSCSKLFVDTRLWTPIPSLLLEPRGFNRCKACVTMIIWQWREEIGLRAPLCVLQWTLQRGPHRLVFILQNYLLTTFCMRNMWSMGTKSRDSSVSVVTRLRAGRAGFDSRQRQGFILFATAFRPALGSAQPPIQWVPGSYPPE